MSEPRIKSSITLDEMIEGVAPLLDRLGVSPGEIVGDLHFIRSSEAAGQAYEILFTVVASPNSTRTIPDAVRDEGHPQGDPFAVWTHRISVEVTA